MSRAEIILNSYGQLVLRESMPKDRKIIKQYKGWSICRIPEGLYVVCRENYTLEFIDNSGIVVPFSKIQSKRTFLNNTVDDAIQSVDKWIDLLPYG